MDPDRRDAQIHSPQRDLGCGTRAKSVYQGGIGAWEVSARYSSIELNDGLVEGGAMDALSLGLNWFLTPTFVVNLNYRHIELDRFGVRGGSDGIMGRVILVLE